MQDSMNVPLTHESSLESWNREWVIERRKFLTRALSWMVSAIVAGEVKAWAIKWEEPEYIDALLKVESYKEVAEIPDGDIESVSKGKNTPRLVTRILNRVLNRLNSKSLKMA